MNTVGDILNDGKRNTIVKIILGAAIAVYLGFIGYSAVHNVHLMLRGVPADGQIFAILGIICLEVSAIFLPLALHFWTHAPSHKMAALICYVLYLLLIIVNIVADYNLVAGQALPGWVALYVEWVVPITPVIAGLGWAVLLGLDPSSKERARTAVLAAAVREAYSNRIAKAALNHQGADAIISARAEEAYLDLVQQIVPVGRGNQPAQLPAKTDSNQSSQATSPTSYPAADSGVPEGDKATFFPPVSRSNPN